MTNVFLDKNIFEERFSDCLFNKNDSVLIALSGGADSTACLHYVKATFPSIKLSAVYIHHGLRLEADDEEQFCKDLCETLSVDYYSENYNIDTEAKKIKKSIEETGHIVRYRVFKEIAARINANKVVTAHHLNDQTESILLQLLSGSSGMNMGIHEKMDLTQDLSAIRPMLKIQKKDIYAYLEENEIDYKIDQTNYESVFDRNKMRNIIIPQIKELINPGLEKTISKYKEVSDEASNFIAQVVDKAIKKSFNADTSHYSLIKFIKNHRYIQKEMLKVILLTDIRYDGRITSELLLHLLQFLSSHTPNSQFVLSKKLNLVKSYDEFYFDTAQSPSLNLPYFLKMGANNIGSKQLIINKIESNRVQKKNKSRIKIDIDTIDIASLQCRYRQAGDDFMPLGMSHFKKLKNYFIDKKIPLIERDKAIIVKDKEKIIWIVGHEIDDRVKITKKSKLYLEIIYK